MAGEKSLETTELHGECGGNARLDSDSLITARSGSRSEFCAPQDRINGICMYDVCCGSGPLVGRECGERLPAARQES